MMMVLRMTNQNCYHDSDDSDNCGRGLSGRIFYYTANVVP